MIKKKRNVIVIPDFMIALLYFSNGDKTLSDVKIEAKITYAHLHAIKKEFLSRGLCIEERTTGKSKNIILTPKGKNIANGVEYILQEMEINKEKVLEYKRRKQKHKTKGMEKKELI